MTTPLSTQKGSLSVTQNRYLVTSLIYEQNVAKQQLGSLLSGLLNWLIDTKTAYSLLVFAYCADGFVLLNFYKLQKLTCNMERVQGKSMLKLSYVCDKVYYNILF